MLISRTSRKPFRLLVSTLRVWWSPFRIDRTHAAATGHGPITQQSFLTSMGASVRLQKLLDGTQDSERHTQLEKGAQRLMDPLGMGTQYKVLGVTSNSEPAYPFSP